VTAMRIAFAIIRIAIAGAVAAAIVGQLLHDFPYWASIGVENPGAHVVHYFSFFTIDSNILNVAVLLIGAYFLSFRRGDDPDWFSFLRASATTYIVTTGIVYNILLRGIEQPPGSTLVWANETMHVVAPIYLLADWLLAPGRTPLGAKRVLGILVFPIVWVAYTLIRAPFAVDYIEHTNYWYPYPFLDPNTSAMGFGSVAIYVVAIAAVIALLGSGVLWLSRHQRTKTT
jgi:hypothetical protein